MNSILLRQRASRMPKTMSAPSGTGIEVSSVSEVTMDRPHGQLGAYMSPLFARRSRKVSQSLILFVRGKSLR